MTAVAKLLPCPFCGSQPKSGWQGASVPGMEDCGYWGIDCCNAFAHAGSEQDAAAQWNRRAALSPAELGGVEAVAWRFLDEDGKPTSKWADMDAKPMHYRDGMLTPGAYPGTSIQYAYTTPRAAEAVTEEMVERALAAFQSKPILQRSNESWQTAMRAALTAALTPPSAEGEL